MRFILTLSIIVTSLLIFPSAVAAPKDGIPMPPSTDVIQLKEDVALLQNQIVAQQIEIALLQTQLTSAVSRIGSNEGDISELQENVGGAQWMSTTNPELTSSPTFADIPDTFVAFETEGEARDMTIHFCAQIDNVSGGRTMMRVNVDGVTIAEPDLAPGPILSWDDFLPTTKCMMWVAPQVVSGPHVISVQWTHDLGGTESRISYRTLAVYY